jgi:hypothetical protein
VWRPYACAIVVDDNRNELRVPAPGYLYMVGVTLGVRDKVGDASFDRRRPHANIEVSSGLKPDFGPVTLGAGAHVLQQRSDVRESGGFAGVAAGEGEVAFEHLAHLVDSFCKSSSAIVGRANESLNASGWFEGWLTPLSMAVRCSVARSMRRFISMKAGPLPHLARMGLNRDSALPKSSAARAAQDRTNLVSEEDDRNGQQKNHRHEHPEHEDVGVRLVGERSARH